MRKFILNDHPVAQHAEAAASALDQPGTSSTLRAGVLSPIEEVRSDPWPTADSSFLMVLLRALSAWPV